MLDPIPILGTVGLHAGRCRELLPILHQTASHADSVSSAFGRAHPSASGLSFTLHRQSTTDVASFVDANERVEVTPSCSHAEAPRGGSLSVGLTLAQHARLVMLLMLGLVSHQ